LASLPIFLGLYAAVVGVIALRRRFAFGVAGVAVFGAIGAWAALGRRTSAPVHVALPSVAGALAGIGALWLIHQRLTPSPRDVPVTIGGATDRRQFFRSSGAVLGALNGLAALTGAAGRRLASRFSAAESRADVVLPTPVEPLAPLPATVETGAAGMTPFITPNADFYRIDTALVAPPVPTDSYRLKVVGMVDRELELTYADLVARPMIERDITLTCVSNEVGDRYVGTARWLGTRLDELLHEAGVQPGADQVVGRSVDGFECGFPVETAMDGRDAMIAVGMNGEPLPIEHGFPARLIVPGLYGFVSATKWLTEIELTTFCRVRPLLAAAGLGAESTDQADEPTPRGLAKVPAGVVPVAGVAWEQTIGIQVVEVQIDDGPWQPAELADAPSNDTWRQWLYRWKATPGRHGITVRAIDKNGAIQTPERAEPIPDGAAGHHQIVVIVD
jgi:DMSO/TMAO reductase YedYZ molybdopterin-dependent catalytic subunit